MSIIQGRSKKGVLKVCNGKEGNCISKSKIFLVTDAVVRALVNETAYKLAK